MAQPTLNSNWITLDKLSWQNNLHIYTGYGLLLKNISASKNINNVWNRITVLTRTMGPEIVESEERENSSDDENAELTGII